MFSPAITSLSIALIALLVAVNVGPAMLLPPPMLRTVCGVVADAEEVVENKAFAAGKAAVDLALKPIAIVGGLKAAAVGTGMKVSGGAIRFVGEKMAKDGGKLEATGAGIKGAGLGVAALGVKPAAEKIVTAAQTAESKIDAASAMTAGWAKSVGDSSIQIDATIDSPFVGHHHKGVSMTAGLDTAIKQHEDHTKTVEQQAQQVEQHAQQVEQHVKQVEQKVGEEKHKRAASKIDTDVMRSALKLVKEAEMEDCVARAICDLNCNPQGFGQDGKTVFMSIVRLQGSDLLDKSESEYYREAATKGRTYSGKCEQCTVYYDDCGTNSTDLIKLASHIKTD